MEWESYIHKKKEHIFGIILNEEIKERISGKTYCVMESYIYVDHRISNFCYNQPINQFLELETDT